MPIKICACQPKYCGSASDISTAMRMIDAAVSLHAPDLICFPECFPTFLHSDPGRDKEMLGERARMHNINIISGALTMQGNKRANSAWIFDRQGKLVKTYYKPLLFAAEREENRVMPPAPLANLLTNVDGYAVGLSICYELLFPEMMRITALAGADFVVSMSNVPRKLCDFWQSLTLTRTFENHMPIVSISGAAASGDYCGVGMITAPPFNVLTSSKTGLEEQILFAELYPERHSRKLSKSPDITVPRLFETGDFGPYFGDLRPEFIDIYCELLQQRKARKD